MRPHRQQPARLPHPWDSPGKNTGVGCHSFSNAWKWKVKVKSLSCVRLLATPWTAAHQAPPSMGFSRQEYWSGVPLPSPVGKPEWTFWPTQYLLGHHFIVKWYITQKQPDERDAQGLVGRDTELLSSPQMSRFHQSRSSLNLSLCTFYGGFIK